MGEDKTTKLLKLINENSVGLREILKEVGKIDKIIAGRPWYFPIYPTMQKEM